MPSLIAIIASSKNTPELNRVIKVNKTPLRTLNLGLPAKRHCQGFIHSFDWQEKSFQNFVNFKKTPSYSLSCYFDLVERNEILVLFSDISNINSFKFVDLILFFLHH